MKRERGQERMLKGAHVEFFLVKYVAGGFHLFVFETTHPGSGNAYKTIHGLTSCNMVSSLEQKEM